MAGRGRIPRFCSTKCRVASHRARHSEIPAEMKKPDRWVRYSNRKVPLTAGTGAAASVTDPATWSTYAEAEQSPHGAGAGLVLDGDGLVCLDLDHCLADGRLAPWAREVLAAAPSTYVEISPGGDGLHIWGRGTVPTGRRVEIGDGAGVVEIYGSGRYITVTGRRFRRSPGRLADLSGLIGSLTG